MATVTVRVGASLDVSGANLFRPLVASAAKARQQINAEFAKISVGGGGGAAAKGQAAITSAAERETAKRIKLIERETQAAVRGAATAASAKSRAQDKAYKEAERFAAKFEREEARMMARSSAAQSRSQRLADRGNRGEQVDNFRRAKHFGYKSVSNMEGVARFGGRAVGQVAQGLGVDFGVASLVGKAVNLEKQSVALSNAGYMRGEVDSRGRATENSKRVRSDDLTDMAREAGTRTGFDAGDVMGGMSKFVGVSGDLRTATMAMDGLAKLAKATGTDIDHMFEAAGNVSANLPDTADKFERVTDVMRMMAAQGKIGAIEVKDLAVQMAKLAATAPQFGGSREESIASMGILAQGARKFGGAASASQAATSVMSFGNTFSKGARVGEFKNAGVQIESGGKLRKAEDIILDSLKATKGDRVGMGKLFMDAQARKVVRPYEEAYREKGGGKAGEDAVKAMFAELKKDALSKQAVDEDFAKAMDTAASKAQVFQNNLEKIAATTMTTLLPALEKLAPKALALAESLGVATTWIANNLGASIAIAIGLAIGKAALGEVISVAIANLIKRMPLPGGGGPGPGPGGRGTIPLATLGVVGGAIATSQVQNFDETEQDDRFRERLKLTAGEATGAPLVRGARDKGGFIRRGRAGEKGAHGEDLEGQILRMGGIDAVVDAVGRIKRGELKRQDPLAMMGPKPVDFDKGAEPLNPFGKFLLPGEMDPNARGRMLHTLGGPGATGGADGAKSSNATLEAKIDTLNATLKGTLNVNVVGGKDAPPPAGGPRTGP